MKSLNDLTFYDILEIPANASPFEIRQAYRDALAIYGEAAVASYSLFTEAEREKILEKIEAAFLTLIDEKQRAQYDEQLVRVGKIEPGELNAGRKKEPVALFPEKSAGDEEALLKRIRKKIAETDVSDISREITSGEFVSGQDLKRLREAIGISLEEVFEVTRINVSILTAIEEDRFERLPPILYLKNFLQQYSELLQLDPKRVAEGYTHTIGR